jgi:hypothetical protein
MSADDLDELVGRALRSLPPPRAPRHLLASVLAAVQASALRPWYERGWFAWPPHWQVAAMGALVLLAFATRLLVPVLLIPLGEPILGAGRAVAGPLLVSLEYVKAASDAGGIVARSLQPLLAVLTVVVVLMIVACAAFGAALTHVVLGRTSEP